MTNLFHDHPFAMNPLSHALRQTLIFTCLIFLPAGLFAQPKDASAEEAAWFAGEWTVTPAPVDGFEDIAPAAVNRVTITHRGGAVIVRHSPARSGRPAASTEFTVKKLGTTFPWWSDAGGSAVAKKVSENVFDLATVGPMGRADWTRALRHTRAKPGDAAAATPQPGLVQILVNHVKPDRQADFELWLQEYRLMVERLIAEGKLSEAERRAYASWRILAPDNETMALNQEAGLPLEYLFLFDPLEAGVSYDLGDYLRRGLGEAGAKEKLEAWRAMLAKPQAVLSGVPL